VSQLEKLMAQLREGVNNRAIVQIRKRMRKLLFLIENADSVYKLNLCSTRGFWRSGQWLGIGVGVVLAMGVAVAAEASASGAALKLDESPVEISVARVEEFAKSRVWQALLHNQVTPWSGGSRIESGSDYFLSPVGHRDSRAELRASIEAFKDPSNSMARGRGNPNCLFPARLKILERHLGVRFQTDVACPELEKWRRRLRSDSVALIYASQLVSSPASMMGHTFLTFRSSQQPDYLNLSVGYAADIPEDIGALRYIYDGLLGGFSGSFSDTPFYERVYEYNNMERRDIWEFTLKLSREERELLIDHLYELKVNAKIRYYFFDENCSFVLLAALQAIRPDKRLVADFPLYVIPIETIKSLSRAGLIGETKYRPSNRTHWLQRYAKLSSRQRAQMRALQVVEDSEVLDTSLEYLGMQRHEHGGKLSTPESVLEREMLVRRAALGQAPALDVVAPPSPLGSIGTYKLELFSGASRSGAPTGYWGMGFRFAVHQYMDLDDGYLPNSGFNFLNVELARRWSGGPLYLNRATLIDVASHDPFTRLDRQYAFRMRMEYREVTDASCEDCRDYFIQPAFGVSARLAPSLDVHFLVEAEWRLGSSLWLGPRVEFVSRGGSVVKFVPSAFWGVDALDARRFLLSVNADARLFRLLREWHIGGSATWSHLYSVNRSAHFGDSRLSVIHDF